MNDVRRALRNGCGHCIRIAVAVLVVLAASSTLPGRPFGSMTPALAVEPGEILKDTALEARARRISAELRCPVCQNQSIDDSNAPLARDLRLLVRERLTAGDNDLAVVDYIVARYGEFVLLKPRFGWHTALLWLAPLSMLAAAVAYILWRLRGTGNRSAPVTVQGAGAAALSVEEEARLARLIEVGGKPRD